MILFLYNLRSFALCRNVLPDFNFFESETWTDREHYETRKKLQEIFKLYKTEKNYHGLISKLNT